MQTLLSYFNLILEAENEFDVDAYISSSLGFKRSRMPQLDPSKIDTFLLHLSNKYNIKRYEVPASKLKPIQGELDIEKVKEKCKYISDNRPVFITTKDWRIADGHHAHAALLMNNDSDNVVAYRSDLPANRLIAILNKMKYSTIER